MGRVKQLMMDQQERLEERAYEEQADLIRKKYGKRAAAKANYGWGVDADDTYTSIATKVYGHGVLNTAIHMETGEITHEWREHG